MMERERGKQEKRKRGQITKRGQMTERGALTVIAGRSAAKAATVLADPRGTWGQFGGLFLPLGFSSHARQQQGISL